MASRTKPPQSDTGVVVAVSAGVFRIDGRLQRYHAGQTFPQGHALVRLRREKTSDGVAATQDIELQRLVKTTHLSFQDDKCTGALIEKACPIQSKN